MSLVRLLAQRPSGHGSAAITGIRYDPERQVSQVLENGTWVDSWEAERLQGTKKFDVETGEDAKGQ